MVDSAASALAKDSVRIGAVVGPVLSMTSNWLSKVVPYLA